MCARRDESRHCAAQVFCQQAYAMPQQCSCTLATACCTRCQQHPQPQPLPTASSVYSPPHTPHPLPSPRSPQDLTGFDDEHGSSPEPPGSSRDGARVPQPSSLGPHRDGAASPHKGFSPQVTGEPKPAAKAPVKGVKEAELVPAAKEAKGKAKLLGGKKEPVKEVESPRIAAAGGRSRHPDEIPGVSGAPGRRAGSS